MTWTVLTDYFACLVAVSLCFRYIWCHRNNNNLLVSFGKVRWRYYAISYAFTLWIFLMLYGIVYKSYSYVFSWEVHQCIILLKWWCRFKLVALYPCSLWIYAYRLVHISLMVGCCSCGSTFLIIVLVVSLCCCKTRWVMVWHQWCDMMCFGHQWCDMTCCGHQWCDTILCLGP